MIILVYNITQHRINKIFSDKRFSFINITIHSCFDNFNDIFLNKSINIETIKYNNINENNIVEYVDNNFINIILTNVSFNKNIENILKNKCSVILTNNSLTNITSNILNIYYNELNNITKTKQINQINQNSQIKQNTIIYILCFNNLRYYSAMEKYKNYNWANPILMKYNDYSLENSFWKQLNEIENEWIDLNMVGVMSYSAFKKIDLNLIDNIISNRLYFPNSYYNFSLLKNRIHTSKYIPNHPYFLTIWNSILPKLNLFSSNESVYNYWMCKPIIMKKFLDWYKNICNPLLVNEQHIFSNANYYSPNFSVDLVKLWGKPYFPHYPFICERLNHIYFVSNFKIVFLISHEKSNTGPPIMLSYINKIYKEKNVKTILLYLDNIKNTDIVEYITNISLTHNCSPVVILNTLVCFPLIDKFKDTNILVYWYIHEWYEPGAFNNWFKPNSFLLNKYKDKDNIKLLFISEKQKNYYQMLFPNLKDSLVIYNKISQNVLYKKEQEKIINNIDNTKSLIISIIGTIEPRKNQKNFICDVFYKIVDNLSCNIKLYLIGKTFEKLNIVDKYKNNIILIGEVDNSIPYIKASDIIVSYSLNEVFPLNILESFYCRKPVVSSNVGCVSEIIDDNINGFLFNSNDSITCYNLLYNLINDENLRKKIGNKAYEKYNNTFNLDTNFDDYLYLLGFN